MVCEIQFLMDWMIEAKKKDHEIYEVLRRKKFVENVAKLDNLYSGKVEEACALACQGRTEDLSKFMVDHPYIKWKVREGKPSLIHTICEHGNLKMLKLFLANLVNEDKYDGTFKTLRKGQKKAIVSLGEDDATPLLCAARGGKLQIVKVSTPPRSPLFVLVPWAYMNMYSF